jgi:radical SAM superfamily enzyme YgiQ (UPF0313 family)
MINLAMCYASREKENRGTEFLFGPLALGYLARHTPPHYSIQTYDEYVGESMDPRTIKADLVAISAITPGITRAYEIGDALGKRGIASVIGGAHVTALPEEALEHFDSVITGEGEGPWEEFLKDFERGRILKTYNGPMNGCLKNLGIPDRRTVHPNYGYQSVLSSRGCPYNCTFCYLTVFSGRKYRTIPHETVLEDLETLRHEPAFVFVDENFVGYSREHIEDRKKLMESIIRKQFRFYWGCQATIGVANDPELMSLMYRAGCRCVFVGVESSTAEGLKEVNKHPNLGIDFREAIRNIHMQKIAVIASCILGMDSHKTNYHKGLIRYIKYIKADFVRVFYMTAWPGTPLFDSLEKEGRVTRNWDQVRKDIPSIQFLHYTHEEILKARKEIMDSFFNVRRNIAVILRWLFVDRSLLGTFIRMNIRNRTSERIRNARAKKWR